MKNHVQPFSILTSDDIYLFKHGHHYRLYEKMGSHLLIKDGQEGVYFCVWAPNAAMVSVIGEFNSFNSGTHQLFARGDGSGIWEGFIAGLEGGDSYKYLITSSVGDMTQKKADPFAFYAQEPEKTFSKIWDLDYNWNDREWMLNRKSKSAPNAPISIYEVHLGSWRKNSNNEYLSYREIGKQLAEYCKDLGFTHVEIMPITEFPYNLSWGYQTTGYFAPTSRFGTPQDFMHMIDILHEAKIGVILDWAPAHFPLDPHGLSLFDGTPLYEYADKRKGFHQDWNSVIFDYSKTEVCNFLISSAMFWLDKYHIDGIRVDAVSSMLYLDYSRKASQWVPNKYGGRENIEAIEFLRNLNCAVYENYDGVQTYAEESTAWPFVSKPAYIGGLGFGYKWNMGWMNDILSYIKFPAENRKDHHYQLLTSFSYAFSENFLLPLSHDEVACGKGSLLEKIQGHELEKFDTLRLLLGYMYAHPGKKLLFMGCEFGQAKEWDFNRQLLWDSLRQPQRSGVQKWVKDLNHTYKNQAALFSDDTDPSACQMIVSNDSANSVLAFMRVSAKHNQYILCVFNFNSVVLHGYKVGVDFKGRWDEILNSDGKEYFGNGIGNLGFKIAKEMRSHGKPYALELSLPALGAVFFKYKENSEDAPEDDKLFPQKGTPTEREILDRIYDIDGLKL
ncbi:MAG: 1,4-alpha-glucan branching protein GlgB [Elusimicrobiota bacterium]|jgi:1,4-alpha-glucan branching enzyme|nr:1,4-alpha-glucan branching protein GlgB [Elusimicrobiota bacterium]